MYGLKQKYGEVALITGASSGIGKTFAQALAKEGMNLILVARRELALQKIAEHLTKAYNIQVQVIAADLIEAGAAETVFNAAKWPVDLLVNNAGYGSYGAFQNLDRKTEEHMVDLNCRQVVALTHAFLPNMLNRKRGAIICLSSIVGHVPAPYMATYSASKAFNRYFALSLAGEVRDKGIDVLALCPGDTKSDFRAQAHFNKTMPIPQRTTEDVVHTALKNLGRKLSVVDGLLNKITSVIGKWWPEKRLIRYNAKMWRPKHSG